MKIAGLAAFLFLAGCACHEPARAGVEAEILQLESLRAQAQLRGDWRALQGVNAPDFTEIAADGSIRTGAENSAGMRAGVIKFSAVDYSDQHVQAYGDVAFVTGVGRRSGSYRGAPFQQHFRYTRIYARADGTWRAVFAQNTRIESPGQK